MLASNSKIALDIWHAKSKICRLQKIRTKLYGLVRITPDMFIHVFSSKKAGTSCSMHFCAEIMRGRATDAAGHCGICVQTVLT